MVDAKNLDSVRALLVARKREIIKQYRAEGVGIGRVNSTDDRYAIVVYLKEKSEAARESIMIEGVPLKFEITGRFKTHNLR